MIAINKSEKEAIIKAFPNIHIVRTMKQKSKRHHYYCEESGQVVRFLNRIRGLEEEALKKEGGLNKHRKITKRIGS